MTKMRLPNETDFEYKRRLIRAHANGTIDADWPEICNLLGRKETPDHLRRVAKGIMEYDDYLYGNRGAACRVLALSDFHVPFQVPITSFDTYAGQIDILVLNGDIVDMQAISKFPKVYRNSPMEELIEARGYVIDLISRLKPTRVVVIDGNHEKRFEAYLAKNLDTDVSELMPSSALELLIEDGFTHYDRRTGTKTRYEPLKDVLGVECEYARNWHYKIGSVIFCHPLSYSSGMLKTAEKAAEYFFRVDRDFQAIVMAHTHKLGMFTQGGITLIEQGCCCQTDKLHYSDGKLFLPQQEGFCYFELDANDEIINERIKLERLN